MLELIRWKNIGIIWFTILVISWVFIPTPQWDQKLWSILALCFFISCVSIFGYLLNDAYDLEIDKINKPNKSSHNFSKPQLIKYAWGFLIGGLVIIPIGLPKQLLVLSILGVLVALLLWIYSTQLKCIPIWGNVTVALLCALVPICTLFIHYDSSMMLWVIAYALFAYGSNLIREIVKDIEDMKGDQQSNCMTLPVKIGFETSKRILIFINVMFILALIAAIWLLPLNILNLGLYTLMIILPALWILIQVIRAAQPNSFSQISSLSKWTMFLALFFLLLQKWI